MNVNVLSWNLQNGFSNPDINLRNLEDAIITQGPDIAVFPEARSESAQIADSTINRFEQEGYTTYDTDYSDKDLRTDKHGITVIARPELVKTMQTIRLAGRNAILLNLINETSFIGSHFVDRTVVGDGYSSIGGEEQRIAQANDAVAFSQDRAAIVGDLNATHKKGFTPTALRVARPFAELFPSLDPRPGFDVPKIKRLGSLAQRLSSMATGKTLQVIEAADFIDADFSTQPTMTKGPIKVQLDHIMVRNLPIIEATTVGPQSALSDHRPISAKLEI